MKSCPAPDCTRQIRDENTACARHWRALPGSLRRKLNANRDHCGPTHQNTVSLMLKADRFWRGLPHAPHLTAPGRAS